VRGAHDLLVRLRKIQLMVEGKEETAITAILVTDGIDRCRVGFVPRHMVRHATRHTIRRGAHAGHLRV
jgi:hypothetical protein